MKPIGPTNRTTQPIPAHLDVGMKGRPKRAGIVEALLESSKHIVFSVGHVT